MVTLDARAFKWILLALLVSLGLNLFVGGVVAGRYFAPEAQEARVLGGRPPALAGRPTAALLRRMAARLPPEDRPIFQAAIADHRSELAAAAESFRQAHRGVREALAAEPFDRAALDAAFADLRARENELRKAFHDTISDAVQRLSPDARRKLARPGRPERRR